MLKYHREILREFMPLRKRARIILFGSVARGNYRHDSDIDVAIITDDEKIKKEAQKIADRILIKYGKVVSLKFISPRKMREKHDPFIKEIDRGVEV